MTANTFKCGILFSSGARSEGQPVKRGQQERKWTIAEMEEIIRQERVVRQQAQLAAEQALTAAKEAQKMILQLEEELEIKGQQLQQERAARKQVELATKYAEKSVVHAAVEAIQHPSPTAAAKGVEQEKFQTKCDVTEQEKGKSPKPKRSREDTQAQSPTVSKKHHGADKVKEKIMQCEGSRQKMSLAEARKASQEEVEKRTQARANEIEIRKKNQCH